MSFVWKIVWKSLAVLAALLIGFVAASQTGWSGADFALNSQLMGWFEEAITGLFATVSLAISIATFSFVQKIAKPALWLMVPLLVYAALVGGVWNGYASDFDAARLEALRYHLANAYTLEHMTPRGRFRSCNDNRIQLTNDAKQVCERVMKGSPGEIIPGSEHKCGLLKMFTCVTSAPKNDEH